MSQTLAQADRAIKLLNQAKEAGYFNDLKHITALLANQNFNSLVSRDAFQKVLADLDAEAVERKRQAK